MELNAGIDFEDIGAKIITIIPHSVGCERLFSRLTHIKSKWQNRMSLDNLTSLAQIKIKLKADLKPKEKVPRRKRVEVVNNNVIELLDEWEDVHEEEDEDLSMYGVMELPNDEEDDDIVMSVTDYFDINMPDFVPSSPEVAVTASNETYNFNVKEALQRYRKK